MTRKSAVIAIQPAALDLEAAAQFVSLTPSTVQKLTREGAFPKPRLLSPRRVGYLVRELQEWMDSRPVADLPPPEGCGYGRAGKAANE